MRVLMLGWAFPPHLSGGVGVACEGIVRGLVEAGISLTYAMPRTQGHEPETGAQLVAASAGLPGRPSARTRRRGTSVAERGRTPTWLGDIYGQGPGAAARPRWVEFAGPGSPYADPGPRGQRSGLLRDVQSFEAATLGLASGEDFDLIHAHDWMTFPAALQLQRESGKPLVVQLHSSEGERRGPSARAEVRALEAQAMAQASRVLCVSQRQATALVAELNLDPARTRVVHPVPTPLPERRATAVRDAHTVLFLGRLTHQKGADLFIDAAEEVVRHVLTARFLVAGEGELATELAERVRSGGLARRVHLLGSVGPNRREELFASAGAFALPARREPFGLAAVEAAQRGLPLILGEDVGAREVLRSSLVVRGGDANALAERILSLFERPALARSLALGAAEEAAGLDRGRAARDLIAIYREVAA